MKKLIIYKVALIATFFITSCSNNNNEENSANYSAPLYTIGNKVYVVKNIKELTDEEYPNNPDIAIRSNLDGKFSHEKVIIERNSEKEFTLTVTPNNNKSDSIVFPNIKLFEFIPFVPSYAKKDNYLEEIGIVNQEWNRMQVNFKEGQYSIKGNNLESTKITRVDLARNCINAYLWELIFYTEENGNIKPCYHGWFDFPKELYADLFKEKNNINYEEYRAVLENWKDPESKEIDLSVLREVTSEENSNFKNLNNELYPLLGERKKKAMNIMVPKNHESINNFLTDSTLFATFSSPGFYNQQEPRVTYLSRLKKLNSVKASNTISNNKLKDKGFELELIFENEEDTTKFIIGGLNKDNIPTLAIQNVNKGYQMPMGIGNHSFYTNYAKIDTANSLESPFYSFLVDQNNNWLDSHTIGIDGPLLHFDDLNPDLLHVWILSFERHCFVGHYIIDLKGVIS
jgi:hypothetical protein